MNTVHQQTQITGSLDTNTNAWMMVEWCHSVTMFLPNVFKVVPVKSVLVVVSHDKHRIALTQLPTEKQKKRIIVCGIENFELQEK